MRTCRRRSSQRKSACSIRLRRRLRPQQRAAPKTKGQEKGKVVPTAILPRPKCQILLRKLAPQAGFEPATLRLTAGCSTIELLRNRRRAPVQGGKHLILQTARGYGQRFLEIADFRVQIAA